MRSAALLERVARIVSIIEIKIFAPSALPSSASGRDQDAASNREHSVRGYKFPRCFRLSHLDLLRERCSPDRPRNAKPIVHWRSDHAKFSGQKKNSPPRVPQGGAKVFLSDSRG